MLTTTNYTHAKFYPWIGEAYAESPLLGFRAMVIGESHYDTGEPQQGFTIQVLTDVVNGRDVRWRTRLFTKTARLFKKALDDAEEDRNSCREFWRQVAFYNFVQDYVSDTRVRPTAQMWREAAPPFDEVLRIHQPNLVLILGKGIAEHLHCCEMRKCDAITFAEIAHPQSFGWKYEEWLPKVRIAISEARALRANRNQR